MRDRGEAQTDFRAFMQPRTLRQAGFECLGRSSQRSETLASTPQEGSYQSSIQRCNILVINTLQIVVPVVGLEATRSTFVIVRQGA